MTAYVICCNDLIEAVVLDDGKYVNERLDELAKKDYEKIKYIHGFFISYTEYINACYWHIYKLPVSERTKQ